MRNIRLLIEYDGTAYSGWQRQKGKPTVQEEIEKCIGNLAGSMHVLHGSGRTDAGVHALGQVANFRTACPIPAPAFAPALNSMLPRDIAVVESAEAPLDFHARFSAKSKTYVYSICTSRVRPAVMRDFFCHMNAPLDMEAVRSAASLFPGMHDFAGFSCSGSRPSTTVRTVKRFEIMQTSRSIHFIVEADGFLYKMARSMAGTLVHIGRGRAGPRLVEEIFRTGKRQSAGPSLPGRGLLLAAVAYEDYRTPLHGRPALELVPYFY